MKNKTNPRVSLIKTPKKVLIISKLTKEKEISKTMNENMKNLNVYEQESNRESNKKSNNSIEEQDSNK